MWTAHATYLTLSIYLLHISKCFVKKKRLFSYFSHGKRQKELPSHWDTDRTRILSTMGPDPRLGGDACTPLAPGGSSVHAGVPRNPPGLGLLPHFAPCPLQTLTLRCLKHSSTPKINIFPHRSGSRWTNSSWGPDFDPCLIKCKVL